MKTDLIGTRIGSHESYYQILKPIALLREVLSLVRILFYGQDCRCLKIRQVHFLLQVVLAE